MKYILWGTVAGGVAGLFVLSVLLAMLAFSPAPVEPSVVFNNTTTVNYKIVVGVSCCNCSCENNVSYSGDGFVDASYYDDGILIEPIITQTYIPKTTPMPAPEFPFLHR